jgi:hypothetical protein
MIIFRYNLELEDFLFYAREAIAGTVTPRCLHATAVNYALAYAMNLFPEKQPYFMVTSEGRNVPEYSSSLIPGAGFYATPASLESSYGMELATFLVKGDREGYGSITGKGGEVLRVSRVSMLPPGTVFTGFILCKEAIMFPERIRLGRFRSPVRVSLQKASKVVPGEGGVASHPVDPLVTHAKKGVLIPMLPYPLVNHACTDRCLRVDIGGERCYVALPDAW